MKINVTLTDQEYAQIEPYIECSQSGNPMADEYVFYNPSERFLVMLGLYGIKFYIDTL